MSLPIALCHFAISALGFVANERQAPFSQITSSVVHIGFAKNRLFGDKAYR
jgi:hypothetical protein